MREYPTRSTADGLHLTTTTSTCPQAAPPTTTPPVSAQSKAQPEGWFGLNNVLSAYNLTARLTSASPAPARSMDGPTATASMDASTSSMDETDAPSRGHLQKLLFHRRRPTSPSSTAVPMETPANLLPAEDHQVLQILKQRFDAGSRPGARTDGFKLGLVVEGGGMRGAVTGGALMAVLDLGLKSCFDAVYGTYGRVKVWGVVWIVHGIKGFCTMVSTPCTLLSTPCPSSPPHTPPPLAFPRLLSRCHQRHLLSQRTIRRRLHLPPRHCQQTICRPQPTHEGRGGPRPRPGFPTTRCDARYQAPALGCSAAGRGTPQGDCLFPGHTAGRGAGGVC